MPPELEEVRQWLKKAYHDRRTAEVGLAQEPPITDTAAFHCQQAVEKLLKAFLVYHEHPFERIHDLRELAGRCSQYDAAFAKIEPIVDRLTPYAVRFRYPGPGDPKAAQIEQALKVAQEVWDFVLERLPPEAKP